MFAKQSTAKTFTVGPILDALGQPYVAATIAAASFVKSVNGGAAVALHEATAKAKDGDQGHYLMTIDTTDTATIGGLTIRLELAGYAMAPVVLEVINASQYDAMFAASGLLGVDALRTSDLRDMFTELASEVKLATASDGTLYFTYAGTYGGSSYYTSSDGWYLWHGATWYVSSVLGQAVNHYWQAVNSGNTILGHYSEENITTIGDATMSEWPLSMAMAIGSPLQSDDARLPAVGQFVASRAEVAAVGSAVAGLPSASTIAAAVWNALTSGMTTVGSVGKKIADWTENALTAAGVWSHATRTLTGASSGVGPASTLATADIVGQVFRHSTRPLYARVTIDGDNATQAAVESIEYSIYELDGNDRIAVTNHQAVSVTVADVIYDTLQSDAVASSWNFKDTIDVRTNDAFAQAGVDYLVEYTLTPVGGGQDVLVRFKLRCV